MRIATRLLLALALCPLAHATTIACVTTPGTYNWSSGASWIGGVAPGSGDRATCGTSGVIIVVDVNTTVGDSPTAGTNVVSFTGGALLAFAQNVSLKSQGGTLAPIRKVAGGSISFDSTLAASPTSTPYTLTANTFTDDATHPTSWTIGNFFTITANSLGTNWRWTNATAGSGTSGITNMLIQNCGDPTGAAPCLSYTPGGSGTLSIGASGSPVIFDHTCGVKWGTGYTTSDGWNFSHVSFENTYTANTYTSTCPPWNGVTGFQVSTGNRTMDTVVFDQQVTIQANGSTYNNVLFMKNYVESIFGGFNLYQTIQNSLIAQSWSVGTLTWHGDPGIPTTTTTLTNDIIVGDPTTTIVSGVPTAQTTYPTGTATAATNGAISSTLTDSTKSFTVHAYVPTGNTGYMLCLTGGTGGSTGTGECNIIADNTATVITVLEKWDITPDTTSTYAIYAGVFNGHWTEGPSTPIGDTAPTISGNIFGLWTGGDNNGDGFHSYESVQGTTCNKWWGTWSSSHIDPVTGLNNYAQFSSVVRSGVYYSSSVIVASSVDPATDGGTHWTVVSTQAGLFSGCGRYEMDSNIFFASAVHDNSGTLLTAGNAHYTMMHNSYFTGAQSLAYDEQHDPLYFPQLFTALQDNLAFADPSRTYVISGAGFSASTLGPYVLADSGSPAGSIIPDAGLLNCFVGGTSSCIDYNGEYGQLTNGYCASPSGSNQGGSPAYNGQCTKPYGTHDVSGNPGLTRTYPSPQLWLQSLGLFTTTHDPVALMPEVYKCLGKINDVAGYNPSCTIANLYTYLHTSVNFTNVSFHNAGADGLDLGAGQYIPPAAGSNANWSGSGVASGSVGIQ